MLKKILEQNIGDKVFWGCAIGISVILTILSLGGCSSVPDRGYMPQGFTEVSGPRIDAAEQQLGEYLQRLTHPSTENWTAYRNELEVFLTVGAVAANEYNRDADNRSIEDRLISSIGEGNRYSRDRYPHILKQKTYLEYLRGKLVYFGNDGYNDVDLWLAIITYFSTYHDVIAAIMQSLT